MIRVLLLWTEETKRNKKLKFISRVSSSKQFVCFKGIQHNVLNNAYIALLAPDLKVKIMLEKHLILSSLLWPDFIRQLQVSNFPFRMEFYTKIIKNHTYKFLNSLNPTT
jgi:hypothetical protein